MNRWENGIISVYRTDNSVHTFPRWVKENGYHAHNTIYKYEVVTIYRERYLKEVHSVKLPLALY